MIGFVSSWDRCLKSGFWDSESFQTFDGFKVFGEDKTMDSLRLFEIISWRMIGLWESSDGLKVWKDSTIF